MIVIAILGILASVIVGSAGNIGCVVGCKPDFSEGEKIGYFTMVTKKGVQWKTWEGEVQLGPGEQMTNQPIWAVSFGDREDLVEQARQARDSRSLVRVKYHKYLVNPITEGATPYRVDGITILNTPAK